MAKAVLISIRPEWVEKIANEWKTIEVRKTKPYLKTPFKCYIYCTNTRLSGYGRAEADRTWDVFNGHVAGEFVCDNIHPLMAESFIVKEDAEKALLGTSLTSEQIKDYAGWKGKKWWNCNDLYKWHISKMKIYDTPKPLSEFMGLRKTKFGYAPVEIKRPPQSWCYVEEQ